MVGRIQCVEVVPCVQRGIPQIFEHITVPLVRPTLTDDRRLAPHVEPI